MLLEHITSNKTPITDIVGFDTEFTGDMKDKGERQDPICIVYKNFTTGEIIKTHGNSLGHLPYSKKTTLFVAHNAGAEVHSMLSLGMGPPKYIWDTMIEDKKLYFGRVKGHGLLRVANRYKIQNVISEDLKKHYIDLILSEQYTPKEFEQILNYCLSDVETLEKVFLNQLRSLEELHKLKGPREIFTQALFSGWAMSATAQIEFNGIPINNDLLSKITDNYPAICKEIITDINSRIDIFDDDFTFNHKKFEILIKKLKLYPRWPKTKTGKLRTDEETIFRFAQENKEINDYYLAREFLDSQKLKGFIPGPDGRARTPLHMYGIKTGRTNQSTSRYPFNCAKPMRNIIKADPDKIGIYFDYRNQEIAIAAYLSGDPQLIASVECGDPYIKTAQLTKAVPDGATKKTHPIERSLYKTSLLATLYGQGIKNMSARLALSIDAGTELQVKIKKTYHVYFTWIKKIVDQCMIRGHMSSKLGWRYWIQLSAAINPRTIYNFPIQSNGSEMLRVAAIGICNAGIECNALIHDGLLVHVPRKKFRKQFMKVKKIMEDASRKILNKDSSTKHVCGVEWQLIRHAMIQDKSEQEKWDRIMSIINKHTRGENTDVKISRGTSRTSPTPLNININNRYINDTR